MKPSLFVLFFSLFEFIASSAKAQFVVDIFGNKVINGDAYAIRSHITKFGGLRLAKTGNETCPLSVVQSPCNCDHGLPWTITSPLRVSFIRTNTSVDFFSFKGEVPCCVPLSSKWTIVEGEHRIKSVKIGEFKNTIKGCFKIQQYNSTTDKKQYSTYKIEFCPINGGSCGALGIFRDGHGHRLLIISDYHPWVPVVFIKVESAEVSKQVITNVLEA